ncbi:hypothetical protein GCM10023403_21500 [Pseudonocardia benzenivorans]|uniref:hypothetical protein n=1 Tax=Pseudonocardia dioxanivorans TaxID=240495 RepID=UPI0006746BFE|nr:hypothetical protein [Pseudonocardia dioxanivorans]
MTDPHPAHRRTTRPDNEPIVQLGGGIAPDLADYARDGLRDPLVRRGRATARARMRVLRHHDPAVERPVVARIVVDLDGTTVVVRVDAARPRGAVDLLPERLGHRLGHLARSGREAGHGLPGRRVWAGGSGSVGDHRAGRR